MQTRPKSPQNVELNAFNDTTTCKTRLNSDKIGQKQNLHNLCTSGNLKIHHYHNQRDRCRQA